MRRTKEKAPRRVSASRQAMLKLTPEERKARSEKMHAAKVAKATPERAAEKVAERRAELAELTARIDALGAEFKALPEGDPRRCEILRALRPLGAEEADLREEVGR